MAKKTQIDRAIEALEAKRQVLDLAIAQLREQQAAKPARTRLGKSATVAQMPERAS